MPRVKHIDTDLLTDLQEVMEDEFNKLITTYLGDSQKRLDALQVCLNNQDMDELRKTAHTLKGSSSNLGAPYLAELCQELENMAKNGLLSGETSLLDKIREEYQLVHTELARWMK